MTIPADDETRKQARELLVKARSYRMLAMVFALVGLVVFIMLYFKHASGHIIETFRQPILVLTMILPFLPAVILAKKADKAQKQLNKIFEKPGESGTPKQG